MKINTKIRYGLRMVAEVARRQTLVNTAELGASMQVSPKYLRKLAGPLEKAGILQSEQGIYGGYRLNRAAATISLADIFAAFGESLNLVDCEENACPLQEGCPARPVWRGMSTILRERFSTTTVAGMLEAVGAAPVGKVAAS
jgi:Rrf2 family protein